MLVFFFLVFVFFVCTAFILTLVMADPIIDSIMFAGSNKFASSVPSSHQQQPTTSLHTKPPSVDRYFLDLGKDHDSTTLDICILTPPDVTHQTKNVLFLHGNAGTLDGVWQSIMIELQQTFGDDTRIVCYDYRCYGYSTSARSPTLANVARDTQVLSDYFLNEYDIQHWDVVYGRSIGAAVALHAFAEEHAHRVTQLLLETPFVGTHATYVPLSTILPERGGCWGHLKKVATKTSVILARDDMLINTPHVATMLNLYNVEHTIVNHAGHNDVHGSKEQYAWIRRSAKPRQVWSEKQYPSSIT